MLALPLFPGVPSYFYRIALSGEEYEIRLVWRERAAGWYMTISDLDGDPLAEGVRLVCSYPLIRNRSQATKAIPGQLYAFDLSDSGDASPGLEDLGRRVGLYYVEPEEETPTVVVEPLGL